MSSAKRIAYMAAFSLAALGLASRAFAHHGTIANGALYLTDEMLEFDGEIIEMLWRNPHPRARLSVVAPNGAEKVWEIELGPSPREFESQGVHAEDFLGRARVAGYRSRRDPDSIGAMHLLLPSGEELVRSRNLPLRWSDIRFEEREAVLDPARVAEDRRTANGLFRVWGHRLLDRPTAENFENEFTERGRELIAQYNAPTDNPELECRTGVVTSMIDTNPMQLLDRGDLIVIRAEEYDARRTIYLDPEAAGLEPAPEPFGFSVGRWDGDALVVRTTHIDYPLMLPDGTPHSDQVELLERFETSEDESLLTYTVTVTDPVIFAQPVTVRQQRRWLPGYQIEEFDCALQWEDD